MINLEIGDGGKLAEAMRILKMIETGEATEYMFELPDKDKAIELEMFLSMIEREKAKIILIDRVDSKVRVVAKLE